MILRLIQGVKENAPPPGVGLLTTCAYSLGWSIAEGLNADGAHCSFSESVVAFDGVCGALTPSARPIPDVDGIAEDCRTLLNGTALAECGAIAQVLPTATTD